MSESKVIPLGRVHSSPEADPQTVELLEEVLAEAKRGEVRGLVMAYVDGGDLTQTVILQGSVRPGMLAGAAALLQHRIVTRWEDG